VRARTLPMVTSGRTRAIVATVAVLLGAVALAAALGATATSSAPGARAPALTADPSVPAPAASSCGFYGTPYGPAGVAYDPARDQVFVADSETNAVVVINASTDQLVTVISLGPACVNPFGLTYVAALSTVFVAEAGGAAVAAISDANNSVYATYADPGQPWEVAYDPTQNVLFTTEPVQGNLTAISLRTGALVASVAIGTVQQPLGIAFDPSSDEVYVADSAGDYSSSVSAISASGYTIGATIPINCAGAPPTPVGNPFDVLLDPSTGNLYASCQAANGLSEISTRSNAQVGFVLLPGAATALAFDAATAEVWAVAPLSNAVYAVSTSSGEVVASAALGGSPYGGVAVDPGNGHVFVSEWKSENVTVLNGSGGVIGVVPMELPTGAPAGTSAGLELGLLIAVPTLAGGALAWRAHRTGRPGAPRRGNLGP
jgi:YVTN family beta-propeller protein